MYYQVVSVVVLWKDHVNLTGKISGPHSSVTGDLGLLECASFKMKAMWTSETWETPHKMRLDRIPEDLNP